MSKIVVQRRALLLGSAAVQRTRLFSLWLGLQLLCRLPHIEAVGRAFYRRWHEKASPLRA